MRIVRSLPLLMMLIMTNAPFALSADQPAQDEQAALVRENFKGADADDNNELSASEFEDFINANADDNIGRSRTIRQFGAYKRAMKQVDTDKNGSVTWDEFVAQAQKSKS